MVGLKFRGNDDDENENGEMKLEPIIGLVSGAEQVIFSPLEWIRFTRAKREMDLYFLGFTLDPLIVSFIPNIEILFSNHGEKQIVVKSKKTWSFIRLVEWELAKLLNLSSCIDYHVQKLSSKKPFANFRFSEITDALTQLIEQKQSQNVYSSSCFKSEIISMELSNYYPEDQISRELLNVYSDFLAHEIEKRIAEKDEITLSKTSAAAAAAAAATTSGENESFDVPF